MRKIAATFLLFLAAAVAAHAQATLRIGDPVELQIAGVPSRGTGPDKERLHG